MAGCPVRDENKCTQCLLLCLLSQAIIKDDKMAGIDYRFCKAVEFAPRNVLRMLSDADEPEIKEKDALMGKS